MQKQLTVMSNEIIAKDTYALKLKGASFHKAGQFINIKVSNHFLRRPFSVADQSGDELLIIYKLFGRGTHALKGYKKGEQLDCLLNLGNGFDINDHKHIYLMGGGVGIPPLFMLAKALKAEHKTLTIVLGFNSLEEVFLEEAFKAFGEVIITTRDGSYGIKGTVLDALKGHSVDYYYGVGPTPMLKALVKNFPHGQVSLEERMGCGFGACMGCSVKTKEGSKRVCKEGPVFEGRDLLWDA